MMPCAKKTNNPFLRVATLLLCLAGLAFAPNSAWQKISAGIYENNIQTILTCPAGEDLIFAGTDKALYVSKDGGRTFVPVSPIFGDLKEIHKIYASPERPGEIYAAGENGLFLSPDKGVTWKKIYSSADEDAQKCRDVIVAGGRIYLATQQGLYQKGVNDSAWGKVRGVLANRPVYHLACGRGAMYAADNSAVYRLNDAGRIEKIFTGLPAEDNEVDIDAETGEPVWKSYIGALFVPGNAPDDLYIGARRQICLIRSRGEGWTKEWARPVPDEITAVALVSENQDSHGNPPPVQDSRQDSGGIPGPGGTLVIATSRGVFSYISGQWQPLYRGMETNRVNDLSVDWHGRLYAATGRGLFLNAPGKALPPEAPAGFRAFDYQKAMKDFKYEPSIRQVQAWATDYAEVHPDKIKNWRRAAKKRAWLPDLSVGVDRDKNKTLSDSVWGSYSGGGQHYIGPEDKTFYDNFGWDVSLSWDLGDLVWSSDQTSIDSRSKLMVELREDILDQVTRLYFERRRNQIELAQMANMPPELIFDKTMRVEELTALIDALTGGAFSRGIHEDKIQ